MSTYFKDKRKHPWHRIVWDIERYSPKGKRDELAETMMLLRSGVFAALGILSLVVALDSSTSKILEVFTSQSDWKTGMREVRSFCSGEVQKMIKKGKIRHLSPRGLERDGFGYLVEPLENAKLKEFIQAKPKIKRGKISLSALEKSVIGCRFLAEQGVTDMALAEDDAKAQDLIEAYERFLVEYEIEKSSRLPITSDTEQVTLNGAPIEHDGSHRDGRKDEESKEEGTKQPELTEYIGKHSSGKTKRSKKRRRK
ncbi:hypothetical protein EU546_03085 [Candidatus Thorarchaeota archaeon]|jgi:hypothetical protein|nr:MAG: hypothetical protein EU546_03085 [Candidatus Thorarchaeota archaeon]